MCYRLFVQAFANVVIIVCESKSFSDKTFVVLDAQILLGYKISRDFITTFWDVKAVCLTFDLSRFSINLVSKIFERGQWFIVDEDIQQKQRYRYDTPRFVFDLDVIDRCVNYNPK